MLRDLHDQLNAPGIIVLNLLDNLLKIDRSNEYILLFKNRAFIDRYISYPNVKILLLPFPSKLIWDQFIIPLVVIKEKINLLFHPKHSIPLLVKCKTLMQLRGSEQWIHPEYYNRIENLYHRLVFPIYCRKANHLIFESELVKKDFQKYAGIPEEKTSMIYLAPSEQFKIITDQEYLISIKEKYDLPTDYFLAVTRIVESGSKFYDGKNLINSIKAFQASKASHKLKFVIVGKRTKEFVNKFPGISESTRRRLIALDALPQEDLPPIYNMARFFLFPSSYESFGIPLTESMVCGCPVITSTEGACPEIVGGAGILVNPKSVHEIANAIDRLCFDVPLQKELRTKGLEEVKRFSWKRSAEETLKVIESLK